MRTKPGQHLSQAGVDLARRVGEKVGPFDQVLTSTVPRAFETSVAMGFAVDRQIELLSSMPENIEVSFDEGFERFSCYVRENPKSVTANFASKLADFHFKIAQSLQEGGRALIISHGGIVEASAVGCVPNAEYEAWGPSCNYCEGVRLIFDEDRFTGAEILRVPGTILLN
jgi:broad specificity phosphatase PhoE